jgi:hypothetical protein
MNANVGFYSLVQYLPDPGRLEVANIGVLLFCPGQRFLRAKTSIDNARIRHIFGSKGHDWDRINSFKQGLEERLVHEQDTIRTEEDLRKFVASRANEIRITEPRFVKVNDCERQLDELFAHVIGATGRHPAKTSLQSLVSRTFRQAKLGNKVERNVVVPIPFVKQHTSKFPFAYQNDRFHVLRPATFRGGGTSDPANQAYRHAVQGKFLYEHKNKDYGEMALVVVGQFESVEDTQMNALRAMFKDNNTRLYTTDELPKLVHEIKTHGKDLR